MKYYNLATLLTQLGVLRRYTQEEWGQTISSPFPGKQQRLTLMEWRWQYYQTLEERILYELISIQNIGMLFGHDLL